MQSAYFFAQDQAGNMQKVHVTRQLHAHPQASAMEARKASYALDDGTALKRIDSETFQVVGTGALVTLMRE